MSVSTSVKRISILIVDDNPNDREHFIRLLSKQDSDFVFNFFEETTGATALKLINQNKIDCILSDYNMPDTDGLGFLLQLAKFEQEKIPVIMLTGQGNEEVAAEAMKYGASDYIIKGKITPAGLLRAIINAIVKNNLEHEIKKKGAELEKSNLALNSAINAKSEFLAHMSHEIRTPLTTIIGMSDLLAEELTKLQVPDEIRKYVNIQKTASDALLMLVNDILDNSKLEADHLKLEQIDFNLRSILQSCVDLFAIKAQRKNIKLLLEVDERISNNYVGDPNRLSQVLINFISNSLKFTEKGEIKISVRLDEKQKILFSVADTGVGIPKEKLKDIFEPYKQMETSIARRYGGTGLGLSISKKLVHLFGGEIGVKSEESKGSTFYFSIPLIESKSKQVLSKKNNGELFNGIKPLKILLIDDSSEIQFLLESIFKKTPFNLSHEENGLKGYERLKKEEFDLVLIDTQMPVMTGPELAKKIREEEKTEQRNPRILIAFSANSFLEDVQKGVDCGFNDYLKKPFKKEDLFALIRKFF